MPPEYGDAATGEAEDQEEPDDVPDDDLRRVIVDAKRQCESEKEKLKFDRMLEDHKKRLYPNCEDGNTKLGTILELLQWKANNDISDNEFEKLLKILKKKLQISRSPIILFILGQIAGTPALFNSYTCYLYHSPSGFEIQQLPLVDKFNHRHAHRLVPTTSTLHWCPELR